MPVLVMVELYEHQKSAMNLLRSGSILCGGVGSGKSRTALAYFFYKVCEGNEEKLEKPRDLYIITTARKRDTKEWEQECAPFRLFSDSSLSISNVRVIVDSWNNIHKYTEVKDAFFVFDEQRVVGSGSWVKSFLKIAKKNLWILLSATPGDTWVDYVPVFMANGFYRTRGEFFARHVIYNRYSKYPKIEKYVDCKRLISLRKKILVNMPYERSTTRHYIDLPSVYNNERFYNLVTNRWNFEENKPIESISELCYLLRKIGNCDESKLDCLDSVLKKHSKVIIFYNYDYELEILKQHLCSKNVLFSEWNGHKHEPIRTNDKEWAYLVQYTAGAEGWNCTETNTIVFYSLNYSYKITEQACGRIDRLNTLYKDLYYYSIVSVSPIDKAIKKALKSKKEFNDKAFVDLLEKEIT